MQLFKKLIPMSTNSIKRLIILRHAKAAWDFDNISDFNRPLTPSGEKSAELIGLFINEKQSNPCLMVTSSAKRAHSTAETVAKKLNYPIENIITDENLYMAWSTVIMDTVRLTPKCVETCILIGHNPGVTDLVNDLGVRLDHLNTASAICFEFNTNKWNKISKDNARFMWFQQPNNLR